MDVARTQLRKLAARRSANVSRDLLDACIIDADTLPIGELGLYRAFQAFWILNYPLFVGPGAVAEAEIRCRWLDAACHINELDLDVDLVGEGIDETSHIVPCKKCGAPFGEV